MGLYLQHLIESSEGFSSVDTAFYSIKWAHRIAGVTDPSESELVKSILEGAKRILSRPKKKKEPVDSNSMIKLFDKYQDRNSLKEVRLLLMCSLMYTGFLRFNELCNITAKDIVFHTSHVNIFIRKSKTDCYRHGNNVVISRLDSSYCPVKLLQSYLVLAKIENNSEFFIFRALSFLKKTNSFILRSKNVKISYTRARELVKEALSQIGLNVNKFGLHSFRAGGATAAAKYDIPDRLFKIHGRWKSDLAKDGYVSDSLEKRLSVSKNLGL